jgi:hypothetical protein
MNTTESAIATRAFCWTKSCRRWPKITLSTDPNDRAISGASSGGIVLHGRGIIPRPSGACSVSSAAIRACVAADLRDANPQDRAQTPARLFAGWLE